VSAVPPPDRSADRESPDGTPPPVFGSWRRAYWILFASLVTYIALGWALTQAYS